MSVRLCHDAAREDGDGAGLYVCIVAIRHAFTVHGPWIKNVGRERRSLHDRQLQWTTQNTRAMHPTPANQKGSHPLRDDCLWGSGSFGLTWL